MAKKGLSMQSLKRMVPPPEVRRIQTDASGYVIGFSKN